MTDIGLRSGGFIFYWHFCSGLILSVAGKLPAGVISQIRHDNVIMKSTGIFNNEKNNDAICFDCGISAAGSL